jgi:hypothetical protein
VERLVGKWKSIKARGLGIYIYIYKSTMKRERIKLGNIKGRGKKKIQCRRKKSDKKKIRMELE